MLSFKALSEKKTKIKINPKQSEITEKNGKCNHSKKGLDCPMHGMDTCPDTENGEGADMSEAKKKDDSYLEVNFKKRQKNNEKARKEMDKVPGQKNPHFESTGDQAYGSQEEVSEESTEEVAETETLLTFKQFDEAEKRIKAKGSDKSKKIMPDAGPAYYKKPKDHVKYEEVVNEEGADRLRDRRMEYGGGDGNTRYDRPARSGGTQPNTFGKKKPKYDGMSAVEKVKAKIEKQYGKGAIIDTKKKK